MVFVGAGFGECPLRSFADGGSGSLSDGGIASAALWFMSARVDFPFGFDIDAERQRRDAASLEAERSRRGMRRSFDLGSRRQDTIGVVASHWLTERAQDFHRGVPGASTSTLHLGSRMIVALVEPLDAVLEWTFDIVRLCDESQSSSRAFCLGSPRNDNQLKLMTTANSLSRTKCFRWALPGIAGRNS